MIFLNSQSSLFIFFFLFNFFALSTSLLDTKNIPRNNSQLKPSKKIQIKSPNKIGIKAVIRKIFQPFLGLFTRFKKASSVEPTWTERDELDHGFGGKWYSKKVVFDLNQFFYSEKVPPCYMGTSYESYNFFAGIADTLVFISILSIACFPKLAESYALKCKALEKAQQEIEQINRFSKMKENNLNMREAAGNIKVEVFELKAEHEANKAAAAVNEAAQAKEEAAKAKEEKRQAELEKEELRKKADEEQKAAAEQIARLKKVLEEREEQLRAGSTEKNKNSFQKSSKT